MKYTISIVFFTRLGMLKISHELRTGEKKIILFHTLDS